MISETIQWRSVADEKPDADTTVLIYDPDSDEPIWPGFYDDEQGHWYVDGYIVEPTHWAPMLAGPRS